jgi:SAM-dependent methyltransferase
MRQSAPAGRDRTPADPFRTRADGAPCLTRINVPAAAPREHSCNSEHPMQSRLQDDRSADLGPDAYAAWRSSEIGEVTERLERQLILELIGGVSGRSVLDVGCGDGDLAVALWQQGAKVVGIDVSDAMIAAAEARSEKVGADIYFHRAAAEHMPFAAESFDLVVAVTVLCFVQEPTVVFREMARVLRAGGRLVIGELGKRSAWAAGRRVRAWFGSQLWRGGKFRTTRELKGLAAQAGLIPGPVRGAVYYPRWAPAVRLMAPYDAAIGRLTTAGAAFVALSASKPAAGPGR